MAISLIFLRRSQEIYSSKVDIQVVTWRSGSGLLLLSSRLACKRNDVPSTSMIAVPLQCFLIVDYYLSIYLSISTTSAVPAKMCPRYERGPSWSNSKMKNKSNVDQSRLISQQLRRPIAPWLLPLLQQWSWSLLYIMDIITVDCKAQNEQQEQQLPTLCLAYARRRTAPHGQSSTRMQGVLGPDLRQPSFAVFSLSNHSSGKSKRINESSAHPPTPLPIPAFQWAELSSKRWHSFWSSHPPGFTGAGRDLRVFGPNLVVSLFRPSK
jgi:hypothetical protein